MSKKIVSFSEKQFETSALWKESEELCNSVSDFLPREVLSRIEIFHACLEYNSKKSLNLDWKYNTDCFLGVPTHLEKFDAISSSNYRKFPFQLIYEIALKSYNIFTFCLLREEITDGTTLKGSKHLMHFTNRNFIDFHFEFQEILEEDEIGIDHYFFDEETGLFYMQDENLKQKLLDQSYEYSYYYKEALLNTYYYEKGHSGLKRSIFSSILRFYIRLCTGHYYSSIFTASNQENLLEEIENRFNEWSIEDLYNFIKRLNDPHINYIYESFDTFLRDLYLHKNEQEEILEDDPENYLAEGDIEMISQLVENSDKSQLLKNAFWKHYIAEKET